jgi:hypothetical protein
MLLALIEADMNKSSSILFYEETVGRIHVQNCGFMPMVIKRGLKQSFKEGRQWERKLEQKLLTVFNTNF